MLTPDVVKPTTLSAPNQGRQSPEPERQNANQKEAPATGDHVQGQAPEGTTEADGGASQLDELTSNPKGPLEDAAAAKTSKSQGQ